MKLLLLVTALSTFFWDGALSKRRDHLQQDFLNSLLFSGWLKSCSIQQDGTTGTKSIVSPNRGDPTFPYVLSLQTRVQNKMTHICSAVLITENKVLATASCVLRLVDLPKLVIGGGNDVSVPEEIQQIREVVSHAIHPNFRLGPSPEYDFAVLLLNVSFELNDFVRRASEISREPFLSAKTCMVVGRNNNVDLPPYQLQLAYVSILEADACEDYVSRLGYAARKTNACVGIQGEAEGWLEIGGPLVCDGMLVGLTGYPTLQLVEPSASIIVYNASEIASWVDSI